MIGDFIYTIHGVNGILISIKKTYYGDIAFIKTSNGSVVYCSVCDIKNSEGENNNE